VDGRVLAVRQLVDLAIGDTDDEELQLARAVRVERHSPSVRRPRRAPVLGRAAGEEPRLRPVGVHHEDVIGRVSGVGVLVNDQRAVRRPARTGVSAGGRELTRVRAVGRHRNDLRRVAEVRGRDERGPVG
jgi:hypothetical protein